MSLGCSQLVPSNFAAIYQISKLYPATHGARQGGCFAPRAPLRRIASVTATRHLL